MKYVPPFLAFMALLFLMALPQQNVYSATDKVNALPDRPDAPVAVTSTPTPMATAVPTGAPTAVPIVPAPELGCLRINFEITGDVARAGTYEVQETNGRPLASWTAQAGWQDSGWINNINISFDAVYVQVFFVPDDGSDPVEMSIVNPAPGTEYGWVARGMCHALEVGWP
jgi:hypothetical protein